MDFRIELAERYYRLALSRAARRDLSGAIGFARVACLLNESYENAVRLLKLCLYEMGELDTGFIGDSKLQSAIVKLEPFNKGAGANREVIEQICMQQVPLNNDTEVNRKHVEFAHKGLEPLNSVTEANRKHVEHVHKGLEPTSSGRGVNRGTVEQISKWQAPSDNDVEAKRELLSIVSKGVASPDSDGGKNRGAARQSQRWQKPSDNYKQAAQETVEHLSMWQSAPSSEGSINKGIIQQISALAQRGKWNKAAHLAKTIPHQSVRILNIQGCLYACAKRYGLAAHAFAEALAKDRSSRLAENGLIETTRSARN